MGKAAFSRMPPRTADHPACRPGEWLFPERRHARGWERCADEPAARGRPLRRAGWALPAVPAAVATGYLAWGAWISAHDPGWLYETQAWWRVWLAR